MEPIIAPIDKRLICKELSDDKFLKKTNRGDNEIFIVDNNNAPNTMLEIGRLREISFRVAGGGTGKAVDIDPFDISANPYKQLIVWNPREMEILGGYRYLLAADCELKDLATSELFTFSEKFTAEYKPYTIELGRSFVQPDFQSARRNPKSLYVLDNLWDGIGGILQGYPDMRYLFGKVTMYTSYNVEARNIILYFLQKHFPDKDGLVLPIEPLDTKMNHDALRAMFTGNSYADDYKILMHEVKARGEHIPPLINSYMNISPSMKTFGTAINRDFGGVEETGILITLADVYKSKVERHFSAQYGARKGRLRQLFVRKRS